MFPVLSIASLLAALPIAWSVPYWTIQGPFNPGFPYGSEPVRGVNLGGWLVLEVCYYPSPPPQLRPSLLLPPIRSRG